MKRKFNSILHFFVLIVGAVGCVSDFDTIADAGGKQLESGGGSAAQLWTGTISAESVSVTINYKQVKLGIRCANNNPYYDSVTFKQLDSYGKYMSGLKEEYKTIFANDQIVYGEFQYSYDGSMKIDSITVPVKKNTTFSFTINKKGKTVTVAPLD